jgi:hypothetical protein
MKQIVFLVEFVYLVEGKIVYTILFKNNSEMQ